MTTTPAAPETGLGRWLTRAEAAELCGRSVDTLRRHQREGRLPGVRRHDGVTLIPVRDLVTAGLLDPSILDEVGDPHALLASRREAEEAETQRAAEQVELVRLRAEVILRRYLRAASPRPAARCP